MNNSDQSDQDWMRRALALAESAQQLDEVPVGALVVKDGVVVGEGYNQPITANDPSAHAEIVALRQAAQNLANYRLTGCTLYVTIEPCTMCAGALVHARIKRLVYGAPEPKAGVISSQLRLLETGFLNHRIEVVSGVLGETCSKLISDFFARKRALKVASGSRVK